MRGSWKPFQPGLGFRGSKTVVGGRGGRRDEWLRGVVHLDDGESEGDLGG